MHKRLTIPLYNNNYNVVEIYRNNLFKLYSLDEIKSKITKDLDIIFFRRVINYGLTKFEMISILNILESRYVILKNQSNNKNILYNFIISIISLILYFIFCILLIKIYFFENTYKIEYNINLTYLNIQKIYYKPFITIGFILLITHIIISVFICLVLINKYPINYIINIRRKIIKEMIYQLENKINNI